MNSIILSDISELLPKLSEPATAAGFPSPADDYIEHKLDLNKYLIKHPTATFFMRAQGHDMGALGISDGDLLIVDRALAPINNSIVVVILDDEFIVRHLKIIQGKAWLYTCNKNAKPLLVTQHLSLQFWGVVTSAIHDLRVS